MGYLTNIILLDIMAYLPILFLVSIVLLLIPRSTRSTPPACETRYCGNPELAIEFPFQLIEDSVESKGCGYTGFEVSCTENNNKPLITLPNAGEFLIKNISLEQQYVWINDPEDCLAKRFLVNRTIDLKDSPFKWDSPFPHIVIFYNVIFYNCTESSVVDPQLIVSCLSDGNYSVVVILDGHDEALKHLSSCKNIGSARIPATNLNLIEEKSHHIHIRKEPVYSDIMLHWFQPSCYCNADQRCGFSSDMNSDATCYDRGGSPPSTTPSYNGKFIRIAWGISVFLFLGWLLLVVSNAIRGGLRLHRRSMEPNTEQLPAVGVGLDHNNNGSMMMIDIEQCPKIQLSESVQLPKSIDNVCSICLSEYEPNETLRSMPQCKHYFHAHCIDAWLKMNATCPLCRKLPLARSALPRFTTS